MKGELNGQGNSQSWSEPEIETWSDEMLQQRTQTLDINFNSENNRNAVAQIDEIDHCPESGSVIPEKNPVSSNFDRRPGGLKPSVNNFFFFFLNFRRDHRSRFCHCAKNVTKRAYRLARGAPKNWLLFLKMKKFATRFWTVIINGETHPCLLCSAQSNRSIRCLESPLHRRISRSRSCGLHRL